MTNWSINWDYAMNYVRKFDLTLGEKLQYYYYRSSLCLERAVDTQDERYRRKAQKSYEQFLNIYRELRK